MSGRRDMAADAGWDLLGRVREVTVAGQIDKQPVVRTMHSVVVDSALWLHGVPRGTMAALEGQTVAVQATEIVARIPSWMRDPERACPATTYYRSAIAHGRLVSEDNPDRRGAVLQHLMEVHQPEGGHVPIDAENPLYAGVLRRIGMWRVEVETLSAVEKLGQDQSAAHVEGILRGLWARGAPGDHAAIEVISAAHPDRPRFANLGAGLVPRCSPSLDDARAAARLAAGRYWNTSFTEQQLADAVLGSTAWVGIERDGALVASARAISDWAKRSWVYDVVVEDGSHRRGLGTALLTLLLAHPALRGTEVNLATRDAAGFYTRLGFQEVWTEPGPPYPRTYLRRLIPH